MDINIYSYIFHLKFLNHLIYVVFYCFYWLDVAFLIFFTPYRANFYALASRVGRVLNYTMKNSMKSKL